MAGKKRKIFKKFFIISLLVFIAAGVLFVSSRKFLGENCGCPVSGNSTGGFDLAAGKPIFNNEEVNYDFAQLLPGLQAIEQQRVLGETTDDRWVEIDLSEQKLYAHEGDRIAYQFLVSSGKWAPTPTGEFRIWSKFKYTKMEGGRKEINTYYYLPNVPYTQFFYKGYGLHGTYWHNNFGHPMSHGCVNLATPDAEKLFYWTSPVLGAKSSVSASKDNPGTKVVIHE